MDRQAALAQLLLSRLERISADSHLAHRASGVRGALIRMMDTSSQDSPEFRRLMELGFRILQRAARERTR